MASKRLLPFLTRPLEQTQLRTFSTKSTPSRLFSLHARPQQTPMPRQRQPKRHFTTTLVRPKDDSSNSAPLDSGIAPSIIYSFTDIQSLSALPSPHRILIDVREPSELLATGTIPTSVNIPIKSAPDAFFLSADEFEDKYGFPRPDSKDEVIFYCKSGVRSKAAARLAGQSGFGGKVGEFPGSWLEWEAKGGKVEKK